MAEALDGCEDIVGGFRPLEGFRVPVVLIDERADIRFEPFRGDVHAPLQLLAGQFGESAFHLIEPRGRSRRKVNMMARTPRQPGFHCGGLVSDVGSGLITRI